jgi:ribose/xylose/arabinose/galactoside ABC-type transport system permease subunit
MSRTPRRLLSFALEHLPWLLAAVILVVMVAWKPAFQHGNYWVNFTKQYFAPAVLALALTPIVLTGGIDLSVGSVTVFTSVVVGILIRDAGWPLGAALAAGLLTGTTAGLLNGSLVSLGVVPLVATLATRELFRGLAYTIGGDSPVKGLSNSVTGLWSLRPLGVPLSLAIAAIVFVAVLLLVHFTWIGRMLFALGDNEMAARFAGVPVRRVKLTVYGFAGLAGGLCGCANVLRLGEASPSGEMSLDLTAIACVVMGGVRITGGVGHVVGTLLGIVTVVTLLAGLATVPPNVRDMVLGGLLIVVAVANEAALGGAARMRASASKINSRAA